MTDSKLLALAKKYCLHFHEGQKRKGNGFPYSTHPFAVLDILSRFGYDDEITACIALLHDVVEDTSVILGEIKDCFGFEIANGVFVLSRNTIGENAKDAISHSIPFLVNEFSDEELYKLRLSFSRRLIKRVKLADMIHNTQDLNSLSSFATRKKLIDAKNFYIPMGLCVAPLMVKELQDNIVLFLKQNSSFAK